MIRGQDETRGRGRGWPGGCAIWTGTSGPRSWPASTTRTGRRCGGSGCAAPAGESPERTQWLGMFVERTAARESARNAAVGGKCGERRCLLDHAGGCFRIRAPPFLGFFTRDCGTRRHAACPVVHAVRRRDCRSPRCPEAGAGLHAGSGAWPAGRAGHAEGRPVGDRSLLRLAGGRRRGMAASAAAVAVCAGPRGPQSRCGQRRDWLSERRHDNRWRGAGRGLVGLEHQRRVSAAAGLQLAATVPLLVLARPAFQQGAQAGGALRSLHADLAEGFTALRALPLARSVIWVASPGASSAVPTTSCLAVMRTASGVIIALDTTILLATAPERLRGRITSLHMTTYGVASRAALAVFAGLLAETEVRTVGVVAGAASVIVGAAWWSLNGRRARPLYMSATSAADAPDNPDTASSQTAGGLQAPIEVSGRVTIDQPAFGIV